MKKILEKKVKEIKMSGPKILLNFWKERENILAIKALVSNSINNDTFSIYNEFYLNSFIDDISQKQKKIIYPIIGLSDYMGILVYWGYSDDYSNLHIMCRAEQEIDITPITCFFRLPVKDVKEFLIDKKNN
jgi:hypothetical protein